MTIQSLLYKAQLGTQPQERDPQPLYSSYQEKETCHPVAVFMQHLGVALPIKAPPPPPGRRREQWLLDIGSTDAGAQALCGLGCRLDSPSCSNSALEGTPSPTSPLVLLCADLWAEGSGFWVQTLAVFHRTASSKEELYCKLNRNTERVNEAPESMETTEFFM